MEPWNDVRTAAADKEGWHRDGESLAIGIKKLGERCACSARKIKKSIHRSRGKRHSCFREKSARRLILYTILQ